MPLPAPFTLTSKRLAKHGFAGRVLALPPAMLGSSVQMLAERPGGAGVRWALQGRRSDSQVWAPLEPKSARVSSAAVDGVAPDSDDEPDSDEESSSASPMVGVVCVVSVRGVLSAEVTEWECGFSDGYQGQGGIVDRWRQAHADPQAVAIVLDAMSPGGDARLCMEAAAEMAAITEASGKPALVFASEATSAMYALACAAASPGGFFAAPSADVANVGTRTWHVDRSKKNTKDGLVVTHFGDPAGKVLGNPDEPLPNEARAQIERDVAETTSRFVALVSAHRGISEEAVRAVNADTRRGEAAKADGFIDGVAGSLAEVVALAYGRATRSAAPVVTTIPVGASSTASPHSTEDLMPLPSSLLTLVGLDPAKPPSDAAALAKLESRLAFAGRMISLFGGVSEDEAEGFAQAAKADASDAVELRAAVAKAKDEADARDRADAAKLLDAKLAAAVRAGKFARAELFDVEEVAGIGADGKPGVVEKLTPQAWTRDMPAKALDAMIANKQARAGSGKPPLLPEAKATNISAAVRSYGAARGYSEEQMAALAAQLPHNAAVAAQET